MALVCGVIAILKCLKLLYLFMDMSKSVTPVQPKAQFDVTNCEKSTFTLTFAVEIINLEIWSDHKDGWVDLGPPLKSLKLQYQLYFGQNFDVEISIFEQVAKITCGPESCWVRTWRFLERRWLTFSIRHAIAVRAADLQQFEAVVNVHPEGGSGGKVQVSQVYFCPLEFGERRYFGEVVESLPTQNETLRKWIREWIWSLLLEYIPPSFLDGRFNVPHPVSDIRHQDTILFKIQEKILRQSAEVLKTTETVKSPPGPPEKGSAKGKKVPEKKYFGLKLSGDTILAGSGRIVEFEVVGERPPELGEIIVQLSSANLPAQDDVPVVFINVGELFDAPLQEFKNLDITHLYTRWTLGDEVHDSELVDIESIKRLDVRFNDSHAIPLNPSSATEVTATFLDNLYNIELRGIKPPPPTTATDAKLFGYDKEDRDFGSGPLPEKKIDEEQDDFLIAITKIDARNLARGVNTFMQAEYSLFPPKPSVQPLSRQGACTNDINLIRAPLKPNLIVPGCLVLSANMTLEVSIGVVGCRPPKITSCFSRLFCIISDSNSIMAILLRVRKVNDELANFKPNEMLTGFALDTGDLVILYVEGPRDGNILKIWDMTEDFYPKVKPVFSTSARFTSRIYPEFLKAILPFIVLKLHAPLALMLACPSVYARPALPIPARLAALKFGRLMQYRYRTLPPRCDLPTAAELRSFRLELCAPPRTYPPPHNIPHEKANLIQPRSSTSSRHSSHCVKGMTNLGCGFVANVNWEKQ